MHVLAPLKEALMWCGVGGFEDTTTTLNFESIHDMVRLVLSKIDKISTVRSQGKGLNKRLLRYLECYVGMTFESKRVSTDVSGERITEYIMYPEWLERATKLGTDKRVRQTFEGYDRFKKIPLASEYNSNKARKNIVEFCSNYAYAAENPSACLFCVSQLAVTVVSIGSLVYRESMLRFGTTQQMKNTYHWFSCCGRDNLKRIVDRQSVIRFVTTPKTD